MKAQSLKNAILQLAVQGRLVPQNPQDEPASELLKKIKTEKAKLIKDKKIKAEKPLAETTDAEKPFDIPANWEWVRLGTICILNPRNNIYDNTEVAFIPMSLIDDGYENSFTFEKRIWKDVKSGFTHFADDDIGIAKIIPCFDNRKSVIFKNLVNGFGAGTTELHIVRVIKETLCRKYILWFLKTHYFINSGAKTYSGTAGQQRISKDFMLNILIPIPPLAEQQRIVEKIEQLIPLVEKYDNYEIELSALEAKFPDDLKKSVLQFAVQGKLVPQNSTDEPASELLKKIKAEKATLIKEKKIKAEKPLAPITDEEKPFDIPDSWAMVRLGDIGVYKKGPFGSSLTKSMFVSKSDTTVKVYEQKNAIQKNHELGDYYITRKYFEEKMNGFEVFPDDIIVSCAGTIGETYIMPSNIEQGIINQALMRMNITKQIDVNYFLIYFDYVLKKSAQSGSKGSAIKNIPPFEIFKSMIFPLPPLAEQQRIVQRVEQMISLCDILADESKLKMHQPPKRLAKVIEFTSAETENEHEHLSAARADEISPETRTKQQERLALLRKKR